MTKNEESIRKIMGMNHIYLWVPKNRQHPLYVRLIGIA